jgi:hypothetical protein
MRPSTPDPLGHDDDVLTQSETLDEDELGADPLEGGMDPAEGWTAANRHGTTAREQATDRPLSTRLEEERPDVATEPPRRRSVATTPLEDLDDSVDDEAVPEEPARRDGQVLIGDDIDTTGESATRRSGYLVTEPGTPAADEISHVRND